MIILELYSPTTYADANDAPTLILHGNADVVVDKQQSVFLLSHLNTIGLENESILYGGGVGHSFNNMTTEQIENMEDRTIGFIKSHTY